MNNMIERLETIARRYEELNDAIQYIIDDLLL